jgi:ferritin
MKTPIKLDKKVVDMLSPKIESELNAFYFYRAASNWCKNEGFFKAEAYFAEESTEELEHAKDIENYLIDWNIAVSLPVIETPITFTSLDDVISKAYTIEYELYEAYEELAKKMFDADVCTFNFLGKFLKIQHDSVAKYSDMLNMLKGCDTAKHFMLLLEKKLFGK